MNWRGQPHKGGVGPVTKYGVAAALAAYPVAHVAVSNPGQVSGPGLALVLGATTVFTISLVLLLKGAGLGRATSMLALVGVLILTYAFGPTHDWLDLVGGASRRSTAVTFLHENLLVLWLFAVATWVVFANRLSEDKSTRVASTLPVVCGVLYLTLGVQTGLRHFGSRGDAELSVASDSVGRTVSSVLGYNPDIYYIVLDGYARADVLQKFYAHDNSNFINSLRARGFAVAEKSTANYYWTFLSLASSLNFGYLDSLIGNPQEAQARGRGPFYQAIRDNSAAAFLRERGYRYVHFQSTWSGTTRNEYADQQISCGSSVYRDDFTRAVVGLTPLKLLAEDVVTDLADCYRSHFESLGRMGTVAGPKFVFAHFLPPHHPYLFDRAGRTLRNATINDQFEFQKRLWEKRDMYVDQLMYVNQRVLEVVDAIVADSKKPPIILIQSDHGPNLKDGLSVEERHAIRFANLSVALLPGAPEGLLENDASAVNKLARIFNFYFGAEIPVLEDRHYYSNYSTPFALVPVVPARVLPNMKQARVDD